MERFHTQIARAVKAFVEKHAGQEVEPLVQYTRPEFDGDLTVVTFPLAKILRQSPPEVAHRLGTFLQQQLPELEKFEVVKGFLNLKFSPEAWRDYFFGTLDAPLWPRTPHPQRIVVEYSSPNTNKPQHLGHIRNNLLGWSIAEILRAYGHEVFKVNLINDRGIHIAQSMVAWMQYGEGATPESTGRKGDHFVGDYYVRFAQENKRQASELPEGAETPLMQSAREILRKWEAGDLAVRRVWLMMNSWVLEGFDHTYRRLGVDFHKVYFESETYLLGKQHVIEGLRRGIFYQKEDGSIWARFDSEDLSDKLLLRSDGTTVYITQDIGTAALRYIDFQMDRAIYVVGDEQKHHFKVLRRILQQLGAPYADAVYHLAYGMVDLPTGKMKSREGTVVDADDLMDEMIEQARAISQELGKTEGLSDDERRRLYHVIGMGALKFHILRNDPQRRILFDPKESVDFFGMTGPFIQYAHARIHSILRKAPPPDRTAAALYAPNPDEVALIRTVYRFHDVFLGAVDELSPAAIAQYAYQLAQQFNAYYHAHPVLKAEDPAARHFRLLLLTLIARTLRETMALLGIEMPERM